MRLIDADELKKNYTASFVNAFGIEEAEMFVGVINQMPTAYDIDKVVEQLEEDSKHWWKMKQETLKLNEGDLANRYDAFEIAINGAIDIVKKEGGFDV